MTNNKNANSGFLIKIIIGAILEFIGIFLALLGFELISISTFSQDLLTYFKVIGIGLVIFGNFLLLSTVLSKPSPN